MNLVLFYCTMPPSVAVRYYFWYHSALRSHTAITAAQLTFMNEAWMTMDYKICIQISSKITLNYTTFSNGYVRNNNKLQSAPLDVVAQQL